MNHAAAIVLLLLCSTVAFSQPQVTTKSKKAYELYVQADNFRVRGQFEEAINLLQQALDKDDKFVEAYFRLGVTYANMKENPKAIGTYEKGLSLTNDLRLQKLFWYELGELYLLTGDYEKAMKVLSAFVNNENQSKPRIDRATVLFRSAEFALKNKNDTSAYHQRPLSDTVNCFVLQYFPALTADQKQLIFTRRATNDPNDTEDLVVSKKDERGRWTTPVSISKNINTRLNEGTCTISADGRKLIFTSCAGRDGIGSCDLYESRKIGEDWTVPTNLGRNVNSAEWESQPSLSADGRTLYFVSDRRAGLGRRDIWISTLGDDGKWMKAVNAGKSINSQYDEMSPFIHANNRTLFFASNGLPGFGGYDIFFVEKDSSQWSAPRNFGAPLNDHDDQYSLFITADGKKGYYAHEEDLPNGHSRSKIYEIDIPAENQMKYRSNYVRGIIRDKDDQHPLAANVELINIGSNAIESLVESDSINGEYLMVLTQGANYALYINKVGYLFKSYNFNYSEVRDFQPIVVNIDLEKVKEGSVAVLNNIFFDVDKYDLQDRSTPELQKIVRFLNENPGIRVQISGHTDNSGAADYNRQLSEKRALSVYNYLIKSGVDKKRLTTKGFGPDKPVATNDTDEGRQQNRRIEFRIVK
ncbi:Tetratricopeptide repeat-containing protein [Chryseolinea serpens]|uniref:Tetratricopeptide repeat-containing protein n=1 Tax=Chryseolinea serpens TaxID=947013 RepID=A0A1M5X250_9BACT|nr:OmpA family protein [Chryseolinea serpens]SHH93618.1 Tetratricopeptide repeat-containing protein [Chryseolinea serpens]